MTHSTNDKFSVQVASVPDRESLVAEVWLGQEQLAELRYEPEGVRMQIYSAPSGQPWDVPYDEFIRVLRKARDQLGPQC